MTRGEAHGLAGRKIPNIWGSLRTAWVNGFIGIPERWAAWYPRRLRRSWAAGRQRSGGA